MVSMPCCRAIPEGNPMKTHFLRSVAVFGAGVVAAAAIFTALPQRQAQAPVANGNDKFSMVTVQLQETGVPEGVFVLNNLTGMLVAAPSTKVPQNSPIAGSITSLQTSRPEIRLTHATRSSQAPQTCAPQAASSQPGESSMSVNCRPDESLPTGFPDPPTAMSAVPTHSSFSTSSSSPKASDSNHTPCPGTPTQPLPPNT